MSLFQNFKHMFGSDKPEQAGQPVKIEEVVEEQPALDLKQIDVCERLRFEYEMEQCNPGHQSLRMVGKPDMKLLDFIRFMGIKLEAGSLTDGYVVCDEWAEKGYRVLDDIAAYGLWDDILKPQEDGRWISYGQGKNVMVHLNYRKGDRKGYLMVHLAPWGVDEGTTHMYLRATVMLRSAEDGTMSGGRCLCCYDENDPQPVIDLFREKNRTAREKFSRQEALSEDEAAAVDFNAPGECGERGMQYAGEHRMSDALSWWGTEYHLLKNGLQHGQLNNDACLYYGNLGTDIGMALLHRGLYRQAYYYLREASHFKEEKDKEEAEKVCQFALGYGGGFFEEAEDRTCPKAAGRMALLFDQCMDLMPEELSRLLWVDTETGAQGEIRDQKEIWMLDVRRLMQDHQALDLYISCRSQVAEIDAELADPEMPEQKQTAEPEAMGVLAKGITVRGHDRSMEQVDNELCIHLQKEGGIIHLQALLPTYKQTPKDPNYDKVLQLSFYAEDPMSLEAFETARKDWQEKRAHNEQLTDAQLYATDGSLQLHYLFYLGCQAFEQKVWGDALYYLTQLFEALAHQWQAAGADHADRALAMDTCYRLGYTYGGLGRHVLAYYFLVQVMGIEFVPLRSEIITNLIRLQDFRAPYLVENELHTLESGQSFADSSEEWRARYRRFLVERKTYLLMGCGQQEAAEDFLHSLLSDAALKDFATKELLHLQELKNR